MILVVVMLFSFLLAALAMSTLGFFALREENAIAVFHEDVPRSFR